MSEETFKLDLVTAEQVLLSVNAYQVVVPGVDGDFAILPGHESVVSLLRPGIITVDVSQTEKKIFIKGGLVQVNAGNTKILAEHGFVVDGTDPAKITAQFAAVEQLVRRDNDEAALDHLQRTIADLQAQQR